MSTLTATANPALRQDDFDASQGAADAVADHNIPALGLSEDHPLTPTVAISEYGHAAIVSWQLSTDSDADPSISVHIHDTAEGITLTPRLWVISEAYGVPATAVHTALDTGNMGHAAMTEAVEAVATLFPGSPMANHLIALGESA